MAILKIIEIRIINIDEVIKYVSFNIFMLK